MSNFSAVPAANECEHMPVYYGVSTPCVVIAHARVLELDILSHNYRPE